MSELSENKRRLLEQRLGARPAQTERVPPSIPSRPDGPAPLSPGQSALLYEHRLRPDQAIYNVVFAYHLRGSLSLDRLEQAIQSAVARHEPLHTTFDGDRRTLAVSEAVRFARIVTTETEFAELARAEATKRFDLERGPLVRVTLAELGPDHHGMLLAIHHVSSDAASLSNLWREIDAVYHDGQLPELHTTYSDHAEWQAARITPADVDFWIDHLGSDVQPVELPLEAPMPTESDGYLTVPIAVTASALDSAGLRPSAFFLSAFAALLQRYTDTDDVVVGVAASTRDHPAVEDLVGYFLTILPLRLPVDPDTTVTMTSRTVEQVMATALRHRDVPYSTIASDLRRRGASSPDPARVMFVYDEPHQAHFRGLEVEGGIVHPEASVTDLTLFARPTAEGFEVSVEWAGGRYRATDIAALMTEYARTVEWAVTHPGSPWTSLPHEPDRRGSPLSRPLEPLPTLIERQVRATPNAAAVRCGPTHLSYAELWERSAAAAAGLAGRGVNRGDRIATLLPRSVEAIAVILGIQRLGAGYVPVDPAYPAERIDRILAEANVRLTVTESSARPLAGTTGVSVDDLLSTQVEGASQSEVELDDPAYVIFTSGSTGTPRGVLVDQRRLAASTLARLDWYDEPVGAYLLPSSLGFDSSVAGVYWTLITGGELILPTEEEVHDVDALGRLIADHRVTHTLTVPSLYRALLHRDHTLLGSLRCAIVAGEACPAALVDLHERLLPGTILSNEYGPTETTVWASAHRCTPGQTPVPIGQPIPGVGLRVVDRWLRPRPSGAAGQLAITGAGLTDGYVGRPELTEEVFVSHPTDGERFYLSGDLVRWNDQGELLFLGRVDHQISVGGIRIEPEEIEAALLASDGVRAAVVRVERQLDTDALDVLGRMTRDDAAQVLRSASAADEPASALAAGLADKGEGTDVLVAYVESDGANVDGIRASLGDRLPLAVIPDVIETVDHLARTEHGKVDRSALPPPLRQRRHTSAPEPGNDLVGVLVDAFREVLDRPGFGSDDDFFSGGGDSLRAVELVTLLEERLGRRVPISALVLGRSPRELAGLIGTPAIDTSATDQLRRSHVVPLRPEGNRPPLLVMPPGGGNLIAYDRLIQALDENYPLIGFDLPGADRDEELPTSVEELCDTYLPQLRTAVPTGPYRFVGWSFGGVVALELAQRLVTEGEEVDLVVMIDTYVPGFQRANRLRPFLDLIRRGDLLGFVARIGRRIRQRVRDRLAVRRGRQAAEQGGQLAPADRDLWLTYKVDQFVERYRPQPYDGRVLFFSAEGTPSYRSTEPWSDLLSDFEVVPLRGSHDGDDGLLSGERVEQVASEITKRLG